MSVPFDAVWSVFPCHVGRGGQSLELVGTIARCAGSPLLGQFDPGGSSESSGMNVCRRISGERHPTPEQEELHSVLRDTSASLAIRRNMARGGQIPAGQAGKPFK